MASFFYPHHSQPSGYHSHSPLFDLFDQPQQSHFYPNPYDNYSTRPYSHSHHPHRQSTAGLFHPQDLGYHHDPYQAPNIHPLRHLRQQKLDRDALENHPDALGYNPIHPLNQLRQQKLGRDSLQNQGLYGQPSRRSSLRHEPSNYEDSLRAERARRLAEAKTRQLGEPKPEQEMKVELTLPDGRHCVVPISWARKMQTKYPGILTNSMIRPHRTPSPPSPQLDQPLAGESDYGSDFYVLDPTQDPSVPVLASSSPSPLPSRPRSPSPQAPKHSPEELDAAARLIQQQFRAHRSLNHLAELESTFDKLKSEFSYPALLDLKFQQSPEQSDNSTPSSTKLAFNHPVNRSVQAFEEGLTQLQIKADAILSRGNPKIKNWRKRLIIAIEAQLDQLDRFKTEAWSAQHLAYIASMKQDHKEDGCEDVEMADEIVNTDVESVSSDRITVDSATLATPHPYPEVNQPPEASEETLIIPAPSDQPNESCQNLVIPATSSAANPAPRSESHTSVTPSRVVTPLVTRDGDLICPAPSASNSNDDILVSPV